MIAKCSFSPHFKVTRQGFLSRT